MPAHLASFGQAGRLQTTSQAKGDSCAVLQLECKWVAMMDLVDQEFMQIRHCCHDYNTALGLVGWQKLDKIHFFSLSYLV